MKCAGYFPREVAQSSADRHLIRTWRGREGLLVWGVQETALTPFPSVFASTHLVPIHLASRSPQALGDLGSLHLASSKTPLPCACFAAVRRAARRCGLKEVGDDEEWTVYWTDCSVSLERVMEMRRFQVNAPWTGHPAGGVGAGRVRQRGFRAWERASGRGSHIPVFCLRGQSPEPDSIWVAESAMPSAPE